MIMPAKPRVGDVYRTENAPGIVFEEVTVSSVSETVSSPRGRVTGAMIASELHSDGTREDKVFHPGYGEFRTAGGGDLEALALAVPTDAHEGSMPAELVSLTGGAEGVLEAARVGNWENASGSIRRMNAAWKTLRSGKQPPRIAEQLSKTLAALTRSMRKRALRRAAQEAIAVSQSAFDLELRYRPPLEIDAAQFHLWTQQLRATQPVAISPARRATWPSSSGFATGSHTRSSLPAGGRSTPVSARFEPQPTPGTFRPQPTTRHGWPPACERWPPNYGSAGHKPLGSGLALTH
jgi:hypothetical protein